MPHLIHSLKQFPTECRGGAVAVGNFDGVHRGHEQLVHNLVEQARIVGGQSIVFTFDPPPMVLLVPSQSHRMPLTDIPRRAELLHRLGVDLVIAFPTDMDLLRLSAEQFFQKILVDAIGALAVVEGPNFRFGRDRSGDTQLLAQLCTEADIGLTIVDPKSDNDGMVSSTRVRELIRAGQVAEANKMLTQPYSVRGRVSHGEGRGRDLGTPTANLIEIPVLIPKHGVYAGSARIAGQTYPAAVHVGPNPTFREDHDKFEIHILDWGGQLYDSEISCSLLREIRPIQRFESPSELRLQIARDVAQCREIFQQYSVASK